ncbi:MAG: DUF448 domain-containing protein [Alphaproteobacteria bacterium]|nr:DUF448 domain-containing protein [Alphaproteobacteria bacterium]
MKATLKRTRNDRSASGATAPDGARRCLVTGELKPRAELIRFVIGPESAVVPDLPENLPGHGLWVTASRDAIGAAAKKNLFAKAAQASARPSATLAEDVTKLLRKRCLDFMGLAKGAGIAVLGETQTEAALRCGKITLYLHAADASRLLDNGKLAPECGIFSREELGAAFGFGQIVYAGLGPHRLAEKLKMEINRLRLMMVD